MSRLTFSLIHRKRECKYSVVFVKRRACPSAKSSSEGDSTRCWSGNHNTKSMTYKTLANSINTNCGRFCRPFPQNSWGGYDRLIVGQ